MKLEVKLNVNLLQVVGMAALSCGLIAVGSSNGDVSSTILQTLIEKTESDLKDTYARFLALGLGLTYLGNINVCVNMIYKKAF